MANKIKIDREKLLRIYKTSAVIDNNIICDFFELEAIELLNKMFSEVFIPQSIIDNEVMDKYIEDLNKLKYSPTAIKQAETYEFLAKIVEKRKGLSDYDAEVVAIAYENLTLCTSNEKRMTATCEEYNIEYTGTLGILCSLYDNMGIDKQYFINLLNKLKSCTCYISPELIKAVKIEFELDI